MSTKRCDSKTRVIKLFPVQPLLFYCYTLPFLNEQNKMIFLEKLITGDYVVLCINMTSRKYFYIYDVLPYESTLSQIKYAVWSFSLFL